MSRKKANKRIFEILHAFGDGGQEKRLVTHWFYFEKRKDLELFENYAWDIGFQTSVKHLRKKKNYDKLLLIIYRVESVNKSFIDFDTMEFFEIAKKYNGIYDGWETPIEMD